MNFPFGFTGKLRDEIESMRSQGLELHRENVWLKTQVAALHTKNKALEGGSGALQTQIQLQRSRNQVLQDEVGSLKAQVEFLQSENARLKAAGRTDEYLAALAKSLGRVSSFRMDGDSDAAESTGRY